MLKCKILVSCVYIYFCIIHSNCIEPISTFSVVTGGIIISASYAGLNYMKCTFSECCEKPGSNFNSTAFDEEVEKYLFGQHLAKFVVSRSLKGHFKRKHPQKPLVMAFHGWTGSGKNYLSKMIVDNVYKKGSESKFVHWYVATTHFPHKQDVRIYRDRLQREIPEYTRQCEHSIFIFDELDKMPAGIIDVLKPYLDYHDHIDGIDYRNNIFIFLSNAGGSDITKIAFNFWLDGKEREDITMKDIEPLVNKGAFNERGGLYKSEIIEKNLIDVFVPFLPLEKKHVKKCIATEIESRGGNPKEETIDRIASQLTFYPPEFELFSSAGCKKVSQKIDIYGDDS